MTFQQHVFVVRFWLEPDGSGGVWRASALNALSGERRYFQGAQPLAAFLSSLERPPVPAATGDDAPPDELLPRSAPAGREAS